MWLGTQYAHAIFFFAGPASVPCDLAARVGGVILGAAAVLAVALVAKAACVVVASALGPVHAEFLVFEVTEYCGLVLGVQVPLFFVRRRRGAMADGGAAGGWSLSCPDRSPAGGRFSFAGVGLVDGFC